jgi:Predicted ATPase (AAA+ superfamily)
MNVYKGALYENIVAEILSKQGYELFYYKKENSTLEQDFFVRTKKTLVPVEVKAKAGTAKIAVNPCQERCLPGHNNGD